MRVIVELVVRMALDNPNWGYTRGQGALRNVGHGVGRGTHRNLNERRRRCDRPGYNDQTDY